MRFGIETIETVREAVGDDFPVVVRIAGNDFVKNGNTNKEWQLIARAFEKVGIDAFNVTGGWHESKVPQITMSVPHGAYMYLAARIKNAVSKPVMMSNRINDPRIADDMIRLRLADIINMARPLIADPYLPRKAKEGKVSEIIRCIACNQGCFDTIFSGESVMCMVNPMAGREAKKRIEKSPSAKRVVIIGGGIAGMQAAITASERGHHVLLFEKNKLGGQLHLAAASPDRQEFKSLIEDFSNALILSDTEIIYEEARLDRIKNLSPDTIIIASGGIEKEIDLPGSDFENVHSAWSVLRGEVFIGEKIVIIGGGATGCETAAMLAHIGTIDPQTARFLIENDAEDFVTIKEHVIKGTKSITILEMMSKIGEEIGLTTRWTVLQDLKRHGVKLETGATVKSINQNSVTYEKKGKELSIPADTIIYAIGTNPNNKLFGELKSKYKDVLIIGDAKIPRNAFEAIRDGFEAGLSI
jgi:2,4-dienoyl-CoA reductase (NADPH2)